VDEKRSVKRCRRSDPDRGLRNGRGHPGGGPLADPANRGGGRHFPSHRSRGSTKRWAGERSPAFTVPGINIRTLTYRHRPGRSSGRRWPGAVARMIFSIARSEIGLHPPAAGRSTPAPSLRWPSKDRTPGTGLPPGRPLPGGGKKICQGPGGRGQGGQGPDLGRRSDGGFYTSTSDTSTLADLASRPWRKQQPDPLNYTLAAELTTDDPGSGAGRDHHLRGRRDRRGRGQTARRRNCAPSWTAYHESWRRAVRT